MSWIAGQRRRPGDCQGCTAPLHPTTNILTPQVCRPHLENARDDLSEGPRHSVGKEMASVTFMPICHLPKGPAGGGGREN